MSLGGMRCGTVVSDSRVKRIGSQSSIGAGFRVAATFSRFWTSAIEGDRYRDAQGPIYYAKNGNEISTGEESASDVLTTSCK